MFLLIEIGSPNVTEIDPQTLLKIGLQMLLKIGSTTVTQNRYKNVTLIGSADVTYDWFCKR